MALGSWGPITPRIELSRAAECPHRKKINKDGRNTQRRSYQWVKAGQCAAVKENDDEH